jgi:hypothetical protein
MQIQLICHLSCKKSLILIKYMDLLLSINMLTLLLSFHIDIQISFTIKMIISLKNGVSQVF